MNNKMLVLLPLYNGNNAVKKIKTILSQTYCNLDLLVICDKMINDEVVVKIKDFKNQYYKNMNPDSPRLIIFESDSNDNPINVLTKVLMNQNVEAKFSYIAILSESYLDKIALEQAVFLLDDKEVDVVKVSNKCAMPDKINLVWHIQHLEAENDLNSSSTFVFKTLMFISTYVERGYIFKEVANHDYDLDIYMTTKRFNVVNSQLIKAYVEPEKSFKEYWINKVRKFTSSLQTLKSNKLRDVSFDVALYISFIFTVLIATFLIFIAVKERNFVLPIMTVLIVLITITIELVVQPLNLFKKTKLLSITLLPTITYIFILFTALFASYILFIFKIDSKWLFKDKLEMFRMKGAKGL